jgi:hypothetical protein
MLLKAWCESGGGMDAELKGEKLDGEGRECGSSNLMGGSDIREAMEGWVLAGSGFGGAVLVLRPSPFSEVYMTATFVLGEFMVPVSDHPMAVVLLATVTDAQGIAYLDWDAPWATQAGSASLHLCVLQPPFSRRHHQGFAQSGRFPS